MDNEDFDNDVKFKSRIDLIKEMPLPVNVFKLNRKLKAIIEDIAQTNDYKKHKLNVNSIQFSKIDNYSNKRYGVENTDVVIAKYPTIKGSGKRMSSVYEINVYEFAVLI